MELMPSEEILERVGRLTLTTHRLRFVDKKLGEAQFASIMLEEVCSSEIRSKGRASLLVLGVLVFLLGVAVFNWYPGGIAIGLILGALLTAGYLLSRRRVLRIASAGATISVASRPTGWGLAQAEKFVDAVENAKNERQMSLRGS